MVRKYNTWVKHALHLEGLPTALQRLEQQASTTGWSPALKEEYNRINDRQYTIRRKIETKIHHVRTGTIPWSPKLQKFRTAIEIWSLLLKKRKGIKVSNKKIQ